MINLRNFLLTFVGSEKSGKSVPTDATNERTTHIARKTGVKTRNAGG